MSYQRVDRHHAAGFADIEHHRVGGDERIRAGIQRAGAEGFDLLIELTRHSRDL
ncbi:hypothetical protein GCM10020260_11880 [Nesterenkonia halobia]|uniref:Resolvase/invertase-type recombinase catalytic domain-containing protein n=1 Tax=Nesterenkonia halobia TaxID=37922 RepID=A0ABP6RFV5_9MICC